MKVEFVDSQREEHGVQPVLQALEQTPAEIAPSTYYAAKTRPESARAASDRVLTDKIEQVHEDNYSVYGARKVWAELRRIANATGTAGTTWSEGILVTDVPRFAWRTFRFCCRVHSKDQEAGKNLT